MYDDLIKRLRNRRICVQQLGTLNDYPLLGEAADAIEELEQYAELYKDGGEAAKKAAETYKAAYIAEHDARVTEFPRWIPVEERFPEDGMTVLVTDGCSIDMAVYNQIGPDWAGGIFVDCGSVVPLINADYVTHWQPLPDLPKEE